jgi:hypothetical protein
MVEELGPGFSFLEFFLESCAGLVEKCSFELIE